MKKEFDDLVEANGLESLYDYFPHLKPLNWSKFKWAENKADGSMIATYSDNGPMRLKSKTALESIMAKDAESYLQLPENADLERAMRHYHNAGYTIVGEWCDSTKPESRIVLAYDKPQLIIFGVRRNSDGQIIDYRHDEGLVGDCSDEYKKQMREILVLNSVERTLITDPEEFNKLALSETGIEGYVYVFEDDVRMKRKTEWYVTQHRLKDTVKNVNALFMAVVANASDDLKSIFHDNPDAINVIVAMENFAQPIIADLISSVESFYEINKDLERKDYAIKAKAEVESYAFGAVMNLYLDRPVDYKQILEKNVKTITPAFKYGVLEETDE